MHYENIPSRKSLFEQVADLPTSERLKYLQQVCGDDEGFIAYVLALCEAPCGNLIDDARGKLLNT